MIKILESIVFKKINLNKIQKCQYEDQAGFTKNKSTETHLIRIWSLIDDAKRLKEGIYIGSLDIKGAYDGIKHEIID